MTTMTYDYYEDTIAAVASPPGKGAISVIRVSGKDTFDIVSACFSEIKSELSKKRRSPQRKGEKLSSSSQNSSEYQCEASRGRASGRLKGVGRAPGRWEGEGGSTINNSTLPHRRITGKLKERMKSVDFRRQKEKKRFFGLIVDPDQDRYVPVDEVIISVYHKPHSYTGEDVIEINCHCNQFIINDIMRLLLRKARLAKPGEFTQRAFFNNKMDLTRAEAVGDLLNVKTSVSHQVAVLQLEGSLYEHIKDLLDELTRYRIALELEIDFTEQDLPELDTEQLRSNLANFKKKLQHLIKTGKEGRIFRDGLTVCLAGAPNVGKSSLFNCLLASERAIVTPSPGTTRDYLEESLSIEGFLVRLIDTAGLRDSSEDIEKIGIGISKDLIEKADKVIYIQDGDKKTEDKIAEEVDKLFNETSKVIKVLNKCDILNDDTINRYAAEGSLPISAKTNEGITQLKQILIADLKSGEKELDEGILTNIRHINAVEKTLHEIEHALQSLDSQMGFEFTAFDLKTASEHLEEIIGKVTDEDLLNKIFSDFCIGK